MTHRVHKWLSDLFIFTIVISVIAITLWGNLSIAPPINLYIDEQISFWPVKLMLYSSDWQDFAWFFFDGGDYRYGRIFWNVIAVAAYFPSLLWGDFGQILAGREIQVILLLFAIIISIKTFIKSPWIQSATFITLVVLPYSSYYMSIPKSEPILLFSIACFLYSYKRHNLRLGLPYWLIAGVCTSIKISFLPILFLVISISIIQSTIANGPVNELLKNVALTILFTLIGFCLGNPYFAIPLLLSFYPLLILIIFAHFFSIKVTLCTVIIIFIAIFLWAPFLVNDFMHHTGIKLVLHNYISATFQQINSDSIGATYGLKEWIAYFYKVVFNNNLIIAAISSFSFFALLLSFPYYLFSKQKLNITDGIPIVIGIIFLMIPVLSVKDRMWGMYFYPALIYLYLGAFLIIDKQLNISGFIEPKKPISMIGATFLTFTLYLVISTWAPNFILDFNILHYRSPSQVIHDLPQHLIGI
jgi:hypothetical protein